MKVLFVVTAFYPEQAIGAVRVTKLAKFLERCGDQVTVLSLAPAPWAMRDETLRFDALSRMRWTMIDQSLLFRRLFVRARIAAIGQNSALNAVNHQNARNGIKTGLGSFAQFAYSVAKAVDWMMQVRRYVRSSFPAEKFDLIVTSYPSFASPFSGLMLKRMGLAGDVLIDFRDPVSYGAGGSFNVLRRMERWMLRKATIASFVSEGVRDKVGGGHRLDETRSIVVNNGFDPDDTVRVQLFGDMLGDSRATKFVYVGALYGGKRDLSPFFSALKEALERSGKGTDAIELHYAGQEGAVFRAQAQAYGLADSISDHGHVPRSDSLRLQMSGDVCLLVTWNSDQDQGILTGKMFEFFMLRKSVLAIVNGTRAGSETKRVLDMVGAGVCYEEAEPAGKAQLIGWIEHALEAKDTAGAVESTYNDAVEFFDFEAAVARLRAFVVKCRSNGASSF